MLPLSLLFLAVAITDPSGSKATAPTALSLTSTPRNLCAGLKPSGIVAICIEFHAGISLLRVIGSLTHRDTMPLVFTPYILSCDDMFIIDATNEAGDTESLLDVQDGNLCFRIAPCALVWYEVHEGDSCVGIIDKTALSKGKAACMVAREADNTERLVPLHRYVDNLLKCFTVRRTRLRDCEALSAYRGYGITPQQCALTPAPEHPRKSYASVASNTAASC